MVSENKGMRPIWYFVGWVLLAIGGVVVISGVYNLFVSTEKTTIMYNLHPNLWWGAIMTIIGLIYVIKNKNIRIE